MEDDQHSYFYWIAIASLTLNALLVLQIIASALLRTLLSWRLRKLADTSVKDAYVTSDPASVLRAMKSHRNHLAGMLLDSVTTLGLFVSSLYLLTGAKVVSRPSPARDATDSDVNTASVIFCIAAGRLGFAITIAFRRMSVIVSARAASMSIMHVLDHVVTIITLSLIVWRREDLLTGALLVMMCVDNIVFSLNVFLELLDAGKSLTRLRLALRVLHCFLVLAFRIIVPIVCTVVSFSAYGRTLSDTSFGLAILCSMGIFYTAFNCYLLMTSARDCWHACAVGRRDGADLVVGRENPAFFVQNNRRACPNVYADLDSVLDQNIPPPYKTVAGDRSLQTPPPSYKTLPGLGHRCLPCAGNHTVTAADQLPPKKPRKAAHKGPLLPFTAGDLPTISEENKDNFSDISLQD